MKDALKIIYSEQKEIALLLSMAELLYWDQMTHMPKDGIIGRSELFKFIEKMRYEKITSERLTKAMKEVYNRDFSSGFFMGKPIDEWCKAYGSKATTTKQYIGKVLNYFTKISVAEIKLESGEIKKGDIIMFQGPTTGVFQQKAEEMQVEGNPTTKVEKGKRVGLKTKQKVRKNDKMFKIKQRRVK